MHRLNKYLRRRHFSLIAILLIAVAIFFTVSLVPERWVSKIAYSACAHPKSEQQLRGVTIRVPTSWYLYSNGDGVGRHIRLYGCLPAGTLESGEQPGFHGKFQTYVDPDANSSLKITVSEVDEEIQDKLKRIDAALKNDSVNVSECSKGERPNGLGTYIKCADSSSINWYFAQQGIVISMIPPPREADKYIDSIAFESK